jgi:TRAP transporter TAXI family solute receptor
MLFQNIGFLKKIWLATATCLALLVIFLRFIYPAPPQHLRIAAGSQGSYFHEVASSYKSALAKEGISLEIVHTRGALDNLQLVTDGKADLALTHDGLNLAKGKPDLRSLGSISYEPIWVFRRKGTPVFTDLSQLKGMRVNLGPQGSGVGFLALQLLSLSGVTPQNTQFFEVSPKESIELLNAGRLDVGFFMDPPENPNIKSLFTSPDILEVDLKDADAFHRNLRYLHVTPLAPSTIDLATAQPRTEFRTVSVTNTLVVNRQLHPAIQYLMLSIMDKTHHAPSLISAEGEFPSDKDIGLPLSDEADIFYKKGMPFLSQYLPFELASIVERLAKSLVPLMLVIFPVLKFIPSIIKWRTRRKFSKLYKSLADVEKRMHSKSPSLSAVEYESMLNRIEEGIAQENLSLSSSDVYVLREHIELVRGQIHRFTERP